MTPTEAVTQAAILLGGKSELARRLDVRPPTISQWVTGKRPVPAARALEIEGLTNGQISRKSLCPGFPWPTLEQPDQQGSVA